jgi:hypothetical protein
MDDDGRRICLIITRAGRDAIGVEDEAGETQPPVKTRSARPSSATAPAENPPTAGLPRSGSKQALIVVVDILRLIDQEQSLLAITHEDPGASAASTFISGEGCRNRHWAGPAR